MTVMFKESYFQKMEYKRFQRMNYTFKTAEEARRVLGIEGTDPSEVFSLTFFVPLCSLLVWLVASIIPISNKAIQLLELFVLNIIMLMALTLFEDHLQLVLGILVFLIFVLLYISILTNSTDKKIKYILKDVGIPKRNINRDFVTGYRGHLLLATATSILAVDFNFFPVRFAKTETYGWSMMDAGVGSFILLQGLCSSHGKSLNTQHSLKRCFMSSFPIFLLGIIRLVATTAVGYHKVVPEYGVHWNFFFTFALTKMICYTILYAVKLPSGLLALTTVITHQLVLSKAGLASLIVSETRRNFFEANKEGIGSLLGFVTIYFCGVQLGKIVWKEGHKISDYIKLLLKLCAIGATGWMLMYAFHFTLQPISRRMANLSYCIWVLALVSLQLAIHLFQEIIITILCKILKNNHYEFLLWKAINYNALFYFLFSNLLTGMVNISINTAKASTLNSCITLILYQTILTATTLLNYKFSIRFKLW